MVRPVAGDAAIEARGTCRSRSRSTPSCNHARSRRLHAGRRRPASPWLRRHDRTRARSRQAAACRSEAATSEAGLVVSRIDVPRPIEIDSRLRTAPTDGNQPEGLGRLRRRPTLERIVQGPGNKSADAHASGGCLPPHLRPKPVFKPDRRAHRMRSITGVKRCINSAAPPPRRRSPPARRGSPRS